MIDKIEERFGERFKSLEKYETPLSPGYTAGRPKDGDVLLNPEEQQEYQGGVGMVLYASKHSRPDLANPVRELSKQMKASNKAHDKEMLRLLKFAVDTKEAKLKFEPKANGNEIYWKLEGVVDTGFATDLDNRRSVTGYFIYLCKALIYWKINLQGNVTLSSTEGEYVGISSITWT